ncbi:MAG: hypothetical protein AUJ71_02610 [Candidatus Omnitrophica bacterium CG1_02_49_16]|nr:MAG: hypothetical protein AUJ71_02610 [Candidatus Omnitrophica bacterium CG1_02_49_16]
MALIFNRHSEKEKRRQLRRNMPKTEIILWSYLKGKGLDGYKFRRQYGIDRYVVDFYSPKGKLVIEIDGDSHFRNEAEQYDKKREEFIRSLGLRIVRFTNIDVLKNINEVLERISEILTPPSSQKAKTPPPRKGRI